MTAVTEPEMLEASSDTFAPLPGAGTWMETLSHLDPKYGGLTAVVPALAAELNRRKYASVSVSAFCCADEAVPEPAYGSANTAIWPAGHTRWLFDADASKRLEQSLLPMDGVHIHGLWDAGTRAVANASRKQNKPYVVSAHGMLEPWALAQGAAKKRIYGALVERPTLQRAAWLHALTSAEAQDYRNFGCKAPIAVIPNAVQPPHAIDADLLEHLFPTIAGKRVVLFLGRLHVKKGTERLLQAWSELYAEFPDAVLVLAGPGDPDYVRGLHARTRELQIEHAVLFTGMLDAQAKWSALQRAHVFVLPSYSEGLSVATLEALSIGTPVIVTEECHLPEVAEANCGWQINTETRALQLALRESLELSPADRIARSTNARRLATKRFSWQAVCAQMAELYRCVLGGGTPSLSSVREATR